MTRLTTLALASVLVFGLSACAASESDVVTKPLANKTLAPIATVKPGASVSMSSVLPKSMTSGSYQTVQLRFDEAHTEGTMAVRIEPSAGLRLFGGASSKTFDMTGSGEHVWDVDVKSDVDGVYFLNVFAEAQGRPRSFSVRLDMGQTTQKMFDEAMPADGALTDGGKIRVLDADETIQ